MEIVIGTDVEAYCTKCKMVLAHVVMAMMGGKPRRVKCNTCGGEHNYRAEKPVAKAAKSEKTTKKPSTRKTRRSWDEIMKEAASKPHKKYAMAGSFSEGDWIEHAKFGLGCVLAFVPPNKITVRFADSTKLLVCNQG
jgi:peptide subunit release factor 1 (eRF1)